MVKYFAFIFVSFSILSCSTTEHSPKKQTHIQINIPEINLEEIEYYTEDQLDKTDILKMKMAGLHSGIEYPEEAREQKIQGRVVLDVLISKKGEPYIIGIKESVHESLVYEAIRVIKKSTFAPIFLSGEPINVLIEFPIVFRLGTMN